MALAHSISSELEILCIQRISYRPIRVNSKTTWALVEVETTDGISGVGEATYFRGSHQFPDIVSAANDRLIGSPLSSAFQIGLFSDESGLAEWAVMSAIEHACWDISGKLSDLPVHALLGSTAHYHIPLYANVNRRTLERSPKGFERSIQDARRDGFTKFKIAPFDNVSPESGADCSLYKAGLERIRVAHDAMDGHGTLMVDCHWRLSMDCAMDLLKLAAELDLGWIECALPEAQMNISDLVRYRSECNSAGITVAGGEQGTSLSYFSRILNEGCYDIIMPDVKYVGGIRRLLQISELAAENQVTFSPHNPSGPVAHLASLHAAAVIENLSILEHQYDEAPLFWELGSISLPQIQNSHSELPRHSGLGFALSNK